MVVLLQVSNLLSDGEIIEPERLIVVLLVSPRTWQAVHIIFVIVRKHWRKGEARLERWGLWSVAFVAAAR